MKVHLISFPKCGRTWLRLMMGKALCDHYGLRGVNLMRFKGAGKMRLYVHHDNNPHYKRPSQIDTNKDRYRQDRVIFLVRDPRDVIVSLFFHVSRREVYDKRQHDLASFVRAKRGSLRSMIAFCNSWAQARHVPAGFLLVRYEDLHRDAAGELRRILEFVGLDVAQDVIDRAVEYASFENMRQYELTNRFNVKAMTPANIRDVDSYKVRRGKVGGYADYLDADTLAWMNEQIAAGLDDFFACYRAGASA